ncbi:MAG: hypothetical protein KBA53_12545 [Thermoclostridium sp.]|nr:hypothetical protein [Thermoclostridium sp.]
MKKVLLKWVSSLMTVLFTVFAGNQAVFADVAPDPYPIQPSNLLIPAVVVLMIAVVAFIIITAIRRKQKKD